jgi:hypothetical protein
MQAQSQLLEHYRLNPNKAWRDGYTTRLYSHWIDADIYDVYQYYMPCHAAKRIRFVKEYFQKIIEPSTPWQFKRRKCWQEFVETSVAILARTDNLMRRNITIIAGSESVNPSIPWALFGECSEIFARFTFKKISDILDHYETYLSGNCYPVEFHFKNMAHLPEKLGNPNQVVAAALVLVYDIIQECGPDCNEFFDLFTNDFRKNPSNIDMDDWFNLRCKILGIEKQVCPLKELTKVSKLSAWDYSIPIKEYRIKTKVEEIFSGIDLLGDEPTKKTFQSTRAKNDGYDDTYSERYPIQGSPYCDIDVHSAGIKKTPWNSYGMFGSHA